jgi:integrase
MKFTDRALRALPPPAVGKRDYIKFDSECRGLGIRVGPNSKTFLFQKLTSSGKVRIPLGHFPTTGLEKARKDARDKVHELDEGEDIGATHRAGRQQRAAIVRGEAVTLETVTEGYIAANPKKAGQAHLKRIRANMGRVFKPVYTRPLASLGFETDLQPCLQAIGQRGAAPVMRRQAGAVLNWAARKHKIANPFVGHEEELPEASPPPRQVSLKLAEVKKVFAATEALEDPPAAALIQFLILSGLRRGEAANLQWRDLDDLERPSSLEIPAARMKGGRKARQHYVPLSSQAAAIIRRQPRHVGSPLVFSRSGKVPISDFSDIKRKLDNVLVGADLPKWVVHDFRRSLTSWSMEHGEDFNVADVVDKVLAHEPHRGIRGVYNMHEYKKERRILLTAWANALVTPEVNDNVEPKSDAVAEPEPVATPAEQRRIFEEGRATGRRDFDLMRLLMSNVEVVSVIKTMLGRHGDTWYKDTFLKRVPNGQTDAGFLMEEFLDVVAKWAFQARLDFDQLLYEQRIGAWLAGAVDERPAPPNRVRSLPDRLSCAEVLKVVVYDYLNGVYYRGAADIATKFAYAVFGVALSRTTLRGRKKASGSNQEPSVETVTPVRTAA